MHRIVHLDLKGAPWKVPYLEKVILQAKRWGATGILFEWEDTFPYIGCLVDIGSVGRSGGDDMYSVDEVQHLMMFVKNSGLEAIQLIQTIGHMEFVLKHPMFRSLREFPKSPAVLCPSHHDSLNLVKMMLKQALDLQPDARYLHIGADEVWYLGVCAQCKLRAESSKYQAACLFLDHIQALAIFLKKKRPHLTVLIWDDMFRSVGADILKEYKLGELVEPVVWLYSSKDHFQIDPGFWEMYRQVFPKVWAGSAFKGANGSCCVATSVIRYASNNEAWAEEIKKHNEQIIFRGVILTGWSRFDHYATLCELLPTALPCLATCLRILRTVNNYNVVSDNIICETLPDDQWPGKQLAQDIYTFAVLRDRCIGFIHGESVGTWLNPWQLENNYTHPVQLEGIASGAEQLILELHPLKESITTNLLSITGKRSTDEWINTLGRPILNRLYEILNTVKNRIPYDAGVTPSSYLKRN